MNKCVIVLDENLPLGLLANASAVIAMTIGKKVENIIGEEVIDASGTFHLGITTHVLPILKTDKTALTDIYRQAKKDTDLLVVDFCDLAQQSKTYDEYIALLASVKNEDLNYLAIGIYGEKKKVNHLCGSLGLVR